MADPEPDITSFGDHDGVLKLLSVAQEVEKDVRATVREVHKFLDDKDGQWDDQAKAAFASRPRYTLDKCNDLVDDIAGAMEQSDFDIQVLPAGGDATKDLAKTYDGLIRNIQNLSNARDIYEAANRSVVRAGMDGWRVSQRWGDNNTFDQDLYIDPIADFVDRVWFDPNSVLQTREDAEYAFILSSMTKRAYEQEYPKGKGRSVGTDDSVNLSDRSPERVIVGELLYKVKATRRIVEMTNGAVYVDDAKFQMIQDELAERDVTVKRERMREVDEIQTRIFDGDEWLTPVRDTVFDLIPIVVQYANWSVRKLVSVYWGIVTKKMDAQRVFNYIESRKVEEGAMTPLPKILATDVQIGPHKESWQNLNTSSDPVLRYKPDDLAPEKPSMIGGAQINPGLESTSQSMLQSLQSTSGIDQLPNQALGLQSGLAVELKQQRGDTRNYKYTRSKQIAVCHTGKILMRAIPKVYDVQRQVRIINDDTSIEMVTLNERIVDEQTGEPVELIDLSKGIYDVTCEVSKSFKNRQGETVNSIVEIASVYPAILQLGPDILLKNMNAPGMDILAERVRRRMLIAGEIPEEQITEEELEFIEAQPEPEPDPVAVALERQAENEDDKVTLDGMKHELEEQKFEFKKNQDSMKEALEQVQAQAEVLNKHADSWAKMGKALESISGPGGVAAFIEQVNVIRDSQAEQL